MAPDGAGREPIFDIYRKFYERSLDIMLFFRAADRVIVAANPAALAAYGYDAAEILTKTLDDIRVEESWDQIPVQIAKAMQGSLRFES